MDIMCEIKVNILPLPFPNLRHLQAIDPSFVTSTKLSNNETKETICEGIK